MTANVQQPGLMDAFLSADPPDQVISAERMEILLGLTGLARRAQAQGRLRSDFEIDDLVLVLLAVRGLSALAPAARDTGRPTSRGPLLSTRSELRRTRCGPPGLTSGRPTGSRPGLGPRRLPAAGPVRTASAVGVLPAAGPAGTALGGSRPVVG